ncbi:MAG: RHS repeat-associated core domain-containing protein [Methylohalobius sp.]|nr:RHS repeat-associated core domain-containing protein [Methylohalobius sp.]
MTVDAGAGRLNLTTTYSHDAVGNLVQVDGSRTDVADTVTYQYNNERRWIQRTDALGKLTFRAYDGNGNLLADGVWSYSYDLDNRLKTAAKAGVSASLAYDGQGRLRQVTVGSATRQFLHDGLALIAEYDGAGALVRRYVPGPGVDEPIVQYAGGVKTWLLGDQLGSIVASADGSGVATAIYTYGPFGESNLPLGVRFGYTGQVSLGLLGVYSYKARMYSPALGRFLQPDPVGYADDLNLYAYVGNDPINFTDPTGQAKDLIGGFLGHEPLSSEASPARWLGRGVRLGVDYGLIALDVANTLVSPTPDVGLIGMAGISSRAVGSGARVTELLRLGGRLIGEAGTRSSIRVVRGSAAEAERLFGQLSGGRLVTPPGYPGILVELPGGGFVGFRPISASGPPTIDVNIPGLSEITKIKFVP